MDHPTVLVFVRFPDPTFPTRGFLNNLSYPDVRLVGSYRLDEDESAEAARAEHRDAFEATLREQAEQFEQRGIRTETDLVFTADPVGTRRRIAERDDVDAILTPGGADTLGTVLIASRHTKNADAKVSCLLGVLDRDDLLSVDLIHVADPNDAEAEAAGERVLREVRSVLVDEDVPPTKISQEVRTGEDVAFELSQAASDHDLLVMGETEQDIGDKIFGPVSDYIVNERDVPVLVVR